MACFAPSRPLASSRAIIRLALLLSLLAVFSFKAQAAENTLVFYADKQVSDTLWQPLFSAIQNDLAKEDYGLSDRTPQLMRSNEVFPGEEFGRVIEVKLLGRCDVPQQAYRPLKPGPLGWVLRVHGEIQPYIYVDCTRMAQVLDPTTLGMSNEQRSRAMSQAISHVLVHEWIHITTQNSGHTEHGISEAQLTAATLVAEPRTTQAPIDNTQNSVADER
ncbi:hypothetical protein H7849_21230 [Alloacidobacterium dinghuense]|uniref:Uncharacterized protein n=1 Tax=Alloacidobacterium dinghuense TaxID=2763107 RepID=A0A7G8BG97_9BACT|nr:hypothetical protein [Alloacidobacterium dinghuense]QNI31567.1 hypothetical protein H7849_21230 [Alloacidobacterium dinghuense]